MRSTLDQSNAALEGSRPQRCKQGMEMIGHYHELMNKVTARRPKLVKNFDEQFRTEIALEQASLLPHIEGDEVGIKPYLATVRDSHGKDLRG
jgi:hypothetical protein